MLGTMFSNSLNNWFGLNAQRERLLKKVPDGPLKTFLSVPFPEPKTSISKVPMLALDFETSALEASEGHLLSMGYVSVENLSINLGSAEHFLVKSQQQLSSDNVAIHQITSQESLSGLTLEQAVEKLLAALAGKVMLVHYAKVEQTFLAKACKTLYGYEPVYPIVDTLVVAKRRLDRRLLPYDPQDLRLTNLRDNYQLPGHYAHNALNDAVATAELLLAELAHHQQTANPLKDFLR